MLLLVNDLHEKNNKERQDRHMRSCATVICTCITTLHLCYIRMHSSSPNQKHVIFSCTLLSLIFNNNPLHSNIMEINKVECHRVQVLNTDMILCDSNYP